MTKRFGTVTWESIGFQLTRDTAVGWAAERDLGMDLIETGVTLSEDDVRILMYGATSCLPIEITWDTHLTD